MENKMVEELYDSYINEYRNTRMSEIHKNQAIIKYESKLKEKLRLDYIENNHDSNKDVIEHSKYVLIISREINEIISNPIDMNLLDESSFLHDISKFQELPNESRKNKKHNVLGETYVNENYSDLGISKENFNQISKVIKCHRGQTIDEKSGVLEMIVRDADKISKILEYKLWKNKETDKGSHIEKVSDKIDNKVGNLCLTESVIVFNRYKNEVIEYLKNNL